MRIEFDHNINLPVLPWYKRHARFWMGCALFLADVLGFTMAGLLVRWTRYLLQHNWDTSTLETIYLASLFSVISFILRGLYPGIGISPVSELRTLTITTSIVALALSSTSLYIPSLAHFSRMSQGLFWLFGLPILPIFRIGTRYLLSRSPAWGEPVILLGSGERTQFLYEHLFYRRMLGFDPVLISMESESVKDAIEKSGENILKLLEHPQVFHKMGIKTAIVTSGTIPEPTRTRLLHMQGSVFERIIKVPDQHDLGSLGVSTLDMDGVFAFEVHQNLGSFSRRFSKRLLDLILTIVGGILIMPFILLIAWAIHQSSPGEIFYKHTRIGKGGKPFKAWKFRTMISNADEALEKTLSENADLRSEWEITQKLKNDPRITPIGRFLRKFSLDELPQLWNVLRGEMSLVGPRPCVENQLPFYGSDLDLYLAVLPGLTGLWQVSGRNNTSYAERVRLDSYYVRNWSTWMDLWILFKTIWVVLKHDGAY